MALIEVENLRKTYFGEVDTNVLRGISFKIEKGEFVSVVGPSGSGKSTLLHILGFLSDYTDGAYHFNGRKYSDYNEDEIAKVRNEEMGFVFQAFNLLPKQTVYQNVSLPLEYSTRLPNTWRERIEKVVDIVGLSHRMDYETYKLSGGEKQRVAIARALVNEPNIIFADEPTGNLDSKSGQAVMETLQRLHVELGHTIVLITHETYTAQHAERIITLRDGVIEEDVSVKNRYLAHEHFQK